MTCIGLRDSLRSTASRSDPSKACSVHVSLREPTQPTSPQEREVCPEAREMSDSRFSILDFRLNPKSAIQNDVAHQLPLRGKPPSRTFPAEETLKRRD